ncbi:hypothetical protein BS78_K203000 [Paspalum vaginatum]|uniref:Peptidase A1 domain-containing protein n=1 Tax=Paspalum vaginatum TaxID=158149 RepID=A0A9W7X7B2_9POAL|nr:hypothetical protein BS78_K203000 [Paspalum vaginatum]
MAVRGHLLSLLVLLALAAAAAAGGGGTPSTGTGTLVPAAPGASLSDRARDDRHRHAYIRSTLALRRRAAEVGASAFAMPLSSGAYTGTGQYFVRFRVGTPAQPFVLVADTGSDLTWVKCRGAAPSPADAQPPPPARVFRPADSKSWAPIACASDTCTSYVPFSLANCSSPASPCAYDYRYKDGSAARGVVGTDSATIALSSSSGGADSSRRAKLQGVVLGCTASYDGQSFQSSDGVLSLGNSNISFASRAAARFGGRFSYCLVDHLAPRNATSFLAFGPAPGPATQRTPLLLDRRMSPFYAVTVDAVYVAGEALDIPADVWDVGSNGGAILDSGTSLTILATPAYRAVVAALSKRLAGLPRVAMDPFEYCYNWTAGAPEVPALEVHFAGSARLEPPAKSYVIDAAPGVRCIGVQEGAWPGVSVIGNILQQEHLWEFDLRDRWLRFKHTRCAQ